MTLIIAGVVIMVVSEAATLAGIEPFASWNTPIAWTGFILFADAFVYRARGNSWIRSAPREFVWLALASIPLWVVFEGFNLVLDNWYYSGLPKNFWLRQFGYAWSFATITPAIFEAAELFAVLRGATPTVESPARSQSGQPGQRGPSEFDRLGGAVLWIALGAIMLIAPFLVASDIARYLAAPVWLGFIFLLDPINARLGAETLSRERVINLSLSGVLCGVLWEFWNYWARAKWHYTVPIMERLKIFEMPLPGYLGFPAFALECFTMYVFVRAMFTKLGRTIAL
jgi:hypothetical protein